MKFLHEAILLRGGCHVPRDYTTFINTAVRNFYLYYVIQNKQKVVFEQVNMVYHLKFFWIRWKLGLESVWRTKEFQNTKECHDTVINKRI